MTLKMKSKLGVHPNTGEVIQMQYTDAQAEGALPNGTHIKKCNAEPDDYQPNGATGRIIGSIATPKEMLGEKLDHPFFEKFGMPKFAYFVEWDALPGVYVGSTDLKVEPIE